MTDTINVPVATLMRWEGELDQIKGAGHISDEIVELFNSQAPAQPTQVYGWQLVPVWPTPKMIDATWYHEIDMSCGIESQGARNKRIYEAMLAAAPQPPVEDEVPCSTHPDAPHGFNRDSSHSLDRYVCDCEGWEAQVQEPVAWVEWCGDVCGVNWWPSELEILPHLTKLYAAPQPSDDAKDAARYRFVRKLENDCWMLNTLQCVSESELDAAIDAAMAGVRNE